MSTSAKPVELDLVLRGCPFCGSWDLRRTEVMICADDGETETIVVECLVCDAQAPAVIWNTRSADRW